MYKGFYGWSLESVKKGTVETKYVVEYISDEKTWNRFLRTEDVELYCKREYEEVGKALTFYLVHYTSEKCFDIKLWEQIFVNGEMVLEQMVEPESTTKFYLMTAIDREMRSRMDKAEKNAEILSATVQTYEKFMDVLGSNYKKMYAEFLRKEGK